MKDFIFDSWWWLQTRFPASLSNVAFPIWSHSTMDFLALSQLVLYQLRSSIVGVKKKRRRKKSQNSKFTRTIITGWIYYFWWIYCHLFRCQTVRLTFLSVCRLLRMSKLASCITLAMKSLLWSRRQRILKAWWLSFFHPSRKVKQSLINCTTEKCAMTNCLIGFLTVLTVSLLYSGCDSVHHARSTKTIAFCSCNKVTTDID